MSIKSELIKLADKLDFNKKFAQANEVDEILKDLDEDGLDSDDLLYEDGLDPDSLSYEDDIQDIEHDDLGNPVGATDSFDRGMDSPEGLLLTRLDIASKLEQDFPGKSPEEISEELGLSDNKDVVSLISKLMDSKGFYQSKTAQKKSNDLVKEAPINGKKAAWYEQQSPDGIQLIIVQVGSDGNYPIKQATPEGSQYIYPMKKIVSYGRPGYKILSPEESAKFGNYSSVYIISEP